MMRRRRGVVRADGEGRLQFDEAPVQAHRGGMLAGSFELLSQRRHLPGHPRLAAEARHDLHEVRSLHMIPQTLGNHHPAARLDLDNVT